LKILFTNTNYEKRLQEMRLEEFSITDTKRAWGDQSLYRILNRTDEFPFGGSYPYMSEKLLETQTVSFDGMQLINEALRGAFWEAVKQAFAHGETLFDADAWYASYEEEYGESSGAF